MESVSSWQSSSFYLAHVGKRIKFSAEIREHIGGDSLAYLSISGMMKALRAESGDCNASFTGEYPFKKISPTSGATRRIRAELPGSSQLPGSSNKQESIVQL
jgi:hypothetical protein